MKALRTVEITIKYVVPMYCKESEIRETFEKNRKEIMDGFEENVEFEDIGNNPIWNEDCQIFRKEGTWLDIEGAEMLMMREKEDA